MNIFDNANPMQIGGLSYDRTFTLYSETQDRTASSSSQTLNSNLGTFIGAEPQQVQRVTQNLIVAGEGFALQDTAFKIFTDDTNLVIKKGMRLTDNTTGQSYKVISKYQTGKSYLLTATELTS
jgi:hypothetical protein